MHKLVEQPQAHVYSFNEEQEKIAKVWKSFIESNSRTSKHTPKQYKSRVEEFFLIVLGKEIQHLTLADINSILRADVTTYITKLTEKGNTDKSIETKLYTVTSFYNELLINNMQVNPKVLSVKKLNVKENHHEALTFEELEMLYEFMKGERSKGLEKYLFLKTLFVTGNRRSATLGLDWDESFTQKIDMHTGKKVWVIGLSDKGDKWVEKPIPDEFYEELQQIRVGGSPQVFDLCVKTMERALKRFSNKLGKNITMHSMKATGVTLGYQLTKDINLCKQYASHEDISTTQIYLKDEKSYVKQLSYNMSRRLDEDKLLKMSHEELLQFLMGHENRDIKNAILMRLG